MAKNNLDFYFFVFCFLITTFSIFMTEKFYKLKVHPKSKHSKILAKSKDSYEIWIKEPAQRGLANKAAIALLAEELNIPFKKIILIKGASSPSKIVKVY